MSVQNIGCKRINSIINGICKLQAPTGKIDKIEFIADVEDVSLNVSQFNRSDSARYWINNSKCHVQ